MNLHSAFLKYPLFTALGGILFAVLVIIFYYRMPLYRLGYYQYWRAFGATPFDSGNVQNNDASLYYEVYGEAISGRRPLLLLHGGLTSIDVFFAQLPALSETRQVIAIDLRGQGRSTMGSSDFSYRLLASDVVAVLNALDVESVDVVGWSDGGIIGLIMGLRYPERIGRLVAMGANFHPQGLTAETRRYLRSADPSRESWMTRLLYRLRSPQPENWNEVWMQVNAMWLTRPDLSIEDLSTIRTPTLVVVGDEDNVELAHSREMAAALVDAKLLVIPEAGHNLLIEKPVLILDIIEEFFAAK